MKHILKVGDVTYAQSIQNFAASYITGFPQREQFLAQFTNDVSFTFYRHERLDTLADVYREQKRLNKYLADKKFDCILIDNPLSSLVVDVAQQTPILFDCIDWYEEMYLKEFSVDARFYLLKYSMLSLLGQAHAVIAQSPVILDSLKAWGLKTEKQIVIPNGYDKELFKPFTKQHIIDIKKKYEERYSVSFDRKNIIVYTGKLGKWYDNIKLIAEAVTDDQLFLIVGDGPIINEIPSRPNVIKCGAVSLQEVPCFTNIADVLVFPVDVDCSPIAISEYLAVGKPIVMGRGRMEWLLKDGVTGSMVDNNKHSWQDGIAKAIRHSPEIRKNNIAVAKDLSWQVLATTFTRFIEKNI